MLNFMDRGKQAESHDSAGLMKNVEKLWNKL